MAKVPSVYTERLMHADAGPVPVEVEKLGPSATVVPNKASVELVTRRRLKGKNRPAPGLFERLLISRGLQPPEPKKAPAKVAASRGRGTPKGVASAADDTSGGRGVVLRDGKPVTPKGGPKSP